MSHQFHSKPLKDIYTAFGSTENGLDQQQVRKNRKEYGSNKLQTSEKKSVWELLLSQVNNLVIYLLVAACIISIIFSDYPEAIAIFIVIILNTIIGFIMEYRAQTSLESLSKKDPLHATAKREGKRVDLKASELVPGDIIHLESGDIVPADARIISSKELNADESMLTGESLPVNKEPGELSENTQMADRKNMLFKGTAITTGKTDALVVATGMESELGKISGMVKEATKDEIPLNRKLEKFSKKLIWLILGLSVVFILMGLIAGKDLYLLLQTAIAWTVAAIPEGLAIVASLALARGMIRLSKQNVIIRKLAAIETLGSTTMILTDKTGTLTKNKLTAILLDTTANKYQLDQDVQGEENSKEKRTGTESFQHAFRIFSLCNDVAEEKDGFRGDPLEVALLEFSREHDEQEFKKLRKLEKLNEDPFDSESMLMGTIHETDDSLFVAAKGATSAILDRCTHYVKNGSTAKLDKEIKEKWGKADKKYSADGLKVIGLAYREESKERKETLADQEEFLDNLVFIGVVAFLDPVRKDVKGPIETCHTSGIKVVMVTGDHPETAMNIAKEVNLIDPEEKAEEKVIHGRNLEKTEDFSNAAVFARVDPKQKLNIISQYKEQGEIVAMTGDGVNDAPALKKADIGIAMGKRGTQVARDVSDMVLMDDAFPSIINAIEQGRTIFSNIRKFIIYQLSYHLAEIIIIAVISFSMFKLPLLPLQILLLNILSDVFPALALGVSKGSGNVMELPPRDPEEPIVTKKDWYTTIIYGVVISAFVTGAYILSVKGLDMSYEVSNNIAFFSLAIAQLLHVFDMREAEERIFNNQVTRNKYIWLALGICAIILFAAYTIPVISNALSFVELSWNAWGIIATTGILPIITIQIIKELRHRL